MQFETIADVYAANDTIRENLINTVSKITVEQEDLPSENGKWTLGAVVEHIAKAEIGMRGICYKLLSKSKAEGKTSDGFVVISQNFIQGTKKAREENQKFDAPEVAQPEGGKPIAETIKVLEQNCVKLNEMKLMFENFDGTTHTFPHPAFGEMNAHDWLVLIGGHEARHTAQINRILAQD